MSAREYYHLCVYVSVCVHVPVSVRANVYVCVCGLCTVVCVV